MDEDLEMNEDSGAAPLSGQPTDDNNADGVDSSEEVPQILAEHGLDPAEVKEGDEDIAEHIDEGQEPAA